MFDCIIEVGELDKSGYTYLDNDKHAFEVVKRVKTAEEAVAWHKSAETWIECGSRSDGGKLYVSHYWCLSDGE